MSTPGRRPVVIPIHAAPARPRPAQASGAHDAHGIGHPEGHGHDAHAHGREHACGHEHKEHLLLDQGRHELHGHSHDHTSCCTPTLPLQGDDAGAVSSPAGTHSVRFRIDQMDCPTEERLIRQKLDAMAGVARLDFNLLARELTVHHTLDATSPIEAALADIGMAPRVLAAGQAVQPLPPAVSVQQRWLLAGSGLAAVAAELVAWATGVEGSLPVSALAVVSMALAGGPTAKKGWIALRHATLNIYALMALAVVGALFIGKWSEAAMVLFLFAVAEAIEALSLERARKAVQALSALAPDVAWVWDAQASGGWTSSPVAEVAVGSRIRIRAGERVPLDAELMQGQGALDESAITGESLPVDKASGDVLFAGSVLADGLLEARTTATASGGTLARMAAAIQQAQAQRAPTQRFVDQFARWYTPAVVLLALGVALLGPWACGALSALSASATGSGFGPSAWVIWQPWVYQALVLLVIACPCALVVSTPVTVVSGLAAAARMGILVKGGAYLEAGRHLRAIALDKTGTLTMGRPVLTDCIALPGAEVHGLPLSDDEALRLAASLDAASTHPVARAVVTGWQARGAAGLSPVVDFALLAGRGVRGKIDGDTWWLGNAALMNDVHNPASATSAAMPDAQPALDALASLEKQGRTAFVLLNVQGPVAVIGVADTLRATSPEAVAAVHALGVHTVVLSGDNPVTVRHVGEQLGVPDARGGLRPADKLRAIEALKAQHGMVAMVGDGVNDAPALARADIGLAMGAAGTATALETADVAIMDDDPRKLASFIRLSQATGRILWQNIALALGIKAVFFALAFTGHATLWMAVFADMGASLLVVFNGLRLLGWRG